MKKIKRKDFIKKTSLVIGAGATGVLTSCGKKEEKDSASIHTREKLEWKMVTTWPPHFPIMGEGADRFAKEVETMSDGQLKIHVYGGGELIPPFETFDAVSQGMAEMGHSSAYYWAGKAQATQFFPGVPFGMNPQESNAWLYYGGGLELWRELYSKFNLIPFPAGNTGAQMGGWFNKEINTIADIKGLKMRMPGIGGKVLTEAGGTTILSPAAEIYTNLERGVLDATEWVGPYHDYLMGFYKIAKYYYYPGWHEPSGGLELIINKSAYNQLSKSLQEIIKIAAKALNISMLSEFEKMNIEYLKKIKQEKSVEIKRYPDEVLRKLKEITKKVLSDITNKDEMSKRIYDSYSKFQKEIYDWSSLNRNY
ncbi:MAG: TRAP transporter substrate-binding protein [Melioribacteraceae bacterium]|nr:TRAP transporter substrate-binding protein [Melioribacteraceae bacterium]